MTEEDEIVTAPASTIRTQKDVDMLPATTFIETRIRKTKISDEFVVKIRQALRYCITVNKQLPTIDIILSYLTQEEAPCRWTYSTSTLHRYMIGKGSQLTDPQNHYEYTKERDDVTAMREKYLLWLQKYRSENYDIFYQDETWLNKNMTAWKIWRYDNAEFLLKIPSGKGERAIICHLGSEATGLLHNCLLCFRGRKSKQDSDYHTEMNSTVFLHWFEHKVFPKMQSRGKMCLGIG